MPSISRSPGNPRITNQKHPCTSCTLSTMSTVPQLTTVCIPHQSTPPTMPLTRVPVQEAKIIIRNTSVGRVDRFPLKVPKKKTTNPFILFCIVPKRSRRLGVFSVRASSPRRFGRPQLRHVSPCLNMLCFSASMSDHGTDTLAAGCVSLCFLPPKSHPSIQVGTFVVSDCGIQ